MFTQNVKEWSIFKILIPMIALSSYDNYISQNLGGESHCFCYVDLSVCDTFLSDYSTKFIETYLTGSEDPLGICAYYKEFFFHWNLWHTARCLFMKNVSPLNFDGGDILCLKQMYYIAYAPSYWKTRESNEDVLRFLFLL